MSDEIIRSRRDVDFSAAGEGVVLRLTNPDLYGLQKLLGEDWYLEVLRRADRFDVTFFADFLKFAPKIDGMPKMVNLATLADMPLSSLARKVVDAVMLAVHGVTFEEFKAPATPVA